MYEKLYKKRFVGKHTFEDIIGISKSIKETIDSAKRFGKTSATILIQGGKLVAVRRYLLKAYTI